MIPLEIKGFTYCHSTNDAYTMVLGEKNGERRLPIIIGENETQAIVFGMEKTKMPRPDTHTMMLNMLESCGIEISSVVINKFKEGVFYADIVSITADGQHKHTDARPSDAIALAVRCFCPILAEEKLIDEVGINMSDINFDENDEEKESGMQGLHTPEMSTPIDLANKYIRTNADPKDFINDFETLSSLPKDKLHTLFDKYINIAIENEDYTSAAKIRDMLNNLNKK